MTNDRIGKGTWLDKVASLLLTRERNLGRPLDLIRVESGIGASGIPHLGSIGDAVRAHGVSMSLKSMGYNSILIAYSDDMDGLRKIPAGLPEWLSKYIAKPVSNIPDPYGNCHDSYGSHMSGLLLEALNSLGVEYEFRSGFRYLPKRNTFKSNSFHLVTEFDFGSEDSRACRPRKVQRVSSLFPFV